MIKNAVIDQNRKYRYMLMRQWGDDKDNFVNFIMLNPSIADDKIDDRTIKACIQLAQNWGFDGFYVTNLFALIATDPKKLKTTDKPVGKKNDSFIEKYASFCKLVVVAWGNHGVLRDRGKEVIKNLNKITTLYCLKKTKIGQPMHPLYVSRNTKATKF